MGKLRRFGDWTPVSEQPLYIAAGTLRSSDDQQREEEAPSTTACRPGERHAHADAARRMARGAPSS